MGLEYLDVFLCTELSIYWMKEVSNNNYSRYVYELSHFVGLDFWLTCSALGYCLLPVLVLAAINIIFSLKGAIGLALSLTTIMWCTITSTRYFLNFKLLLTTYAPNTDFGMYYILQAI